MPTEQEHVNELAMRGLPHSIVENGHEIKITYADGIFEVLGLQRYGKKWDSTEDAALAELFAQGATCEQAAYALKRSINAIQSRASYKYGQAKTEKEKAKWRNRRSGGLPKLPAKKSNAIANHSVLIRDTIVTAQQNALKQSRKGKKTAKKSNKK